MLSNDDNHIYNDCPITRSVRYRPELIGHPAELNVSPSSAAGNCQRVFDLLEREYGIPPVMTGQDLAASEIPDKLTMVSYLTQVYETFRGAIPRPLGRPVYKVSAFVSRTS